MVQAAPYGNFLGHDDPPSPEEARFRVLPVPYDLTTSYRPGARLGPAAIIEASRHVEWYDERLGVEPSAAGIATLAPIEPETSAPRAMMERVGAVARRWIDPGRFLLTLGGEHSISAPLAAAHRELWPGLTVLQIDAHADLRDRFEGSRFNHACVARRIVESGIRVVQVGIRSLSAEEAGFLELAADAEVTTLFAGEIRDRPEREWGSRVVESLGSHVYVSVDLDALDPGVMPATGTPEPGGLSWWQLVDLLERVAASTTCVGADIVELSPIPGLVAPDFLAARLAYRLMGLVGVHRGWLPDVGPPLPPAVEV